MSARAIGMDNTDFKQMLRDDVWPEVSRKAHKHRVMTHEKKKIVFLYRLLRVRMCLCNFFYSVSFESRQLDWIVEEIGIK